MGLADERRASGRVMEAERRQIGRDIVDDLQALAGPIRQRRTLAPVAAVGAKPAQRGRANYVPPATAGGGGIASPLDEPSFAAREFWPDGLLSSDGLFVIPAIKTLHLVDADGAAVVINLASPVAP